MSIGQMRSRFFIKRLMRSRRQVSPLRKNLPCIIIIKIQTTGRFTGRVDKRKARIRSQDLRSWS